VGRTGEARYGYHPSDAGSQSDDIACRARAAVRLWTPSFAYACSRCRDRRLRDPQPARDLGVGEALADEAEDLALTPRQARPVRGPLAQGHGRCPCRLDREDGAVPALGAPASGSSAGEPLVELERQAAVARAEPLGEQPSSLRGRVVDPPPGVEQDDRSTSRALAVLFERAEELGDLPARARLPPERLDVRPQRERQLAVAFLEVADLTVEAQQSPRDDPSPMWRTTVSRTRNSGLNRSSSRMRSRSRRLRRSESLKKGAAVRCGHGACVAQNHSEGSESLSGSSFEHRT
jgi:hypothetical protein